MSRPRSQSNPNPRRTRLPYTYAPLSSPRHIRLIRLLAYDAVLGQAYITLTEHSIDAIANQFTALSYTWSTPIEPYELTATGSPPHPNPDTIELVILPPASFQTFHRRDDLATKDNMMLDTYTSPDIRVLTLPGTNLSDFFRSYLLNYPHRHLRPRGDGSGARYAYSFQQVSHLWIDAVCIDQGNADEKAAQIPLMGEIYSRAGRVLAWLGAGESRLATFGWWHRAVYPELRRFLWAARCQGKGDEGLTRLRAGNPVEERFWRDVVGFREKPVTGDWARAWADYWAFYRTRRYFHRVWIVQEVVVAGRFEMMAGAKGEELSWRDMAGFTYLMSHVGWIETLDSLAGTMLSSEYTDASVRGFSVADIGALQKAHQERDFYGQGWPRHWWAALSSVRTRDCFVQQDKVYATVGILQQVLPEGTPLPFPVDAKATPEEVYTHAATALLLNYPDLTLLSFTDYPVFRKLAKLPSWVPDLSIAKFPGPLGAFDTRFTTCTLPPSSSPPPRTITPSGELRLRGFKLDTIASKTEYQPPMNIRLAESVLAFLASMPAHYPHVPPAPQETNDHLRDAVLVHVLTGYEHSNINRDKPGETARLRADFTTWLLIALSQVHASCLLQPGDAGYSAEAVSELEARRAEIERLVASLGPERGLVPGVAELRAHGELFARARRGEGPWPAVVSAPNEFKDQIRRVMLYRSLFATAQGWVGVCTETCEVGDEVWLLEGGAVPYVLRRRADDEGEVRFSFGGECYVHGVMQGELVRGERESMERKMGDVVIV